MTIYSKLHAKVIDGGWVDKIVFDGCVDRNIQVPSPDGLALKIRMSVYRCQENKPSRQWRGHVYIDQHEIFRIYSRTLKSAKSQLEMGLHDITGELHKMMGNE